MATESVTGQDQNLPALQLDGEINIIQLKQDFHGGPMFLCDIRKGFAGRHGINKFGRDRDAQDGTNLNHPR